MRIRSHSGPGWPAIKSGVRDGQAQTRSCNAGGGFLIRTCVLRLALAFLCLNLLPKPSLAAHPAEINLREITALIEREKFPEAEAKLRDALKAEPDSAPVHRLLGIVYQREGKFPQAEEALERASKLFGGHDPQTLFLLCQTKFALKKTQEAVALAAQSSVVAANDPRAHYAIGRLLLENGLPEQAAREFEQAHTLAPQNPAVTTELLVAYLEAKQSSPAENLVSSFLRGASYEDLIQAGSRLGERGQFAAAARIFERALELRPGSYDARFNLAFARSRQGRAAEALDLLDHISPQAAEGQADYHYLRGKLELALHQDEVAGEEWLKALKQQPDNESLCSDTGLLFFRFENFWKALKLYENCARRLPNSVAIGTGLGLTYFRLGKYDEATTTFKKVLTLRPDADAPREALAFLDYVSGDLAEAKQILENRLGGQDADYYTYYLHALVLLRLEPHGDHTAARRSLDETLRRSPQFAPAYFQRAKLWDETGQTARALADLQTATQLDNTYAEPFYLMAQIDYRLGKRNEAEQARREYSRRESEREEKRQKRLVESRLLQALQ